MGGGDHDATVEAAVHCLVRDAGRGDHVQHVGVRTTGNQPAHQGRLKHVAGAACVLADDDAGLALLARTVVPPHEAADLEGMLDVEPLVGPPSKAVGAEVLHPSPPRSVALLS